MSLGDNSNFFSEEEFTEAHLAEMNRLSQIYAKNKGEAQKLDQQRKALKAILMKEAEANGIKAIQAQERDALADQRYWLLTEALGTAVQKQTEAYYAYDMLKIRFEKWRTERADFRATANLR